MQQMKKIYLRPSLFAIQACTIASYHINLSESDRVIDAAWFFLGLAQRMSYQLGFQVDCLDLPLTIRRTRLRVWWVLGCADTVLSYCFGRPIQLNATEYSTLPSFDQILTTSISFVATDVILAKQMLQLSSTSTAEYFISFCDIMRLMRRLAMQKGNQAPSQKVREQQGFSLLSILNPENNDSSSSHGSSPERESDNSNLRTYREIEKSAFKIYARRISSDPNFYIAENATLLQGHLMISFISILIDCNKPFIDVTKKDLNKDEEILEFFSGPPRLTVEEYSSKHPLLKFAWVARLVVRLIQKFGENFLLPAPPLTWYVILQAIFALLVVLDRIGPAHSISPTVASLVKDLDVHLSRHSNRWALLKDMYAISSPLVNRYLTRFSRNLA
ncbi:hypothetical protein DSO57_1002169 [Entomophthora muscae]|uniref:Uncharacterized protein n=1 Tax=Entomophthora muscae TaxID=34485 RepID=A0ACC2T8R4_9FUNG|nr:hypothetical protein DSO57_1002169 [Entomophthora muscae]